MLHYSYLFHIQCTKNMYYLFVCFYYLLLFNKINVYILPYIFIHNKGQYLIIGQLLKMSTTCLSTLNYKYNLSNSYSKKWFFYWTKKKKIDRYHVIVKFAS